MKKKIILLSLITSINFLSANSNLNDLELMGQNILKNSNDIKQMKIEIEEIKQKYNLTDNNKLRTGDIISNNEPKKIKTEAVLFKANKATVIRNSPSINSTIVAKVKKGQVVKRVIFESKYKIDSWIFIGNGFIMKSEFSEVSNEN